MSFASEPRNYRSLNISTSPKKRLLGWRYPEITQNTGDEIYQSSEVECMHTEETQPGTVVTGCGGMRADVTTFIDGVEPSSVAPAVTRLPVHLNSSVKHCKSWRSPRNKAPQSFKFFACFTLSIFLFFQNVLSCFFSFFFPFSLIFHFCHLLYRLFLLNFLYF